MHNKFKSYKRIHAYDHEQDIEKGKISKEKHKAIKARRQQKNVVDKIIRTPERIDETDLDTYEAALNSEKKESNNAKGHKERLKALLDAEEID